MLKGVNPFGYNSFYDFGQHPFTEGVTSNGGIQLEDIDDTIYDSDEFRMYAYKVNRCPRMRSHDWTECPFAHRGEKATRRDPLKVQYLPITCPMFRNGKCTKADLCQYAHGVFEYWLHPARYRTRVCNAGPFCQRKVCFFAHTPAQIRPEKKIVCPFVYKPRHLCNGDGSPGFRSRSLLSSYEEGSSSSLSPNSLIGSSSMMLRMDGERYFDGMSELLNGLKNQSLPQEQAGVTISEADEPYYPDFPAIDWISDLVQ
ncbi:hypothetical protein K2173_027645 [Erythroxylum novogranatense]|uniref:C3H1-type domain-containing protein n=1 Tax=Erythroxylum novogranatense TaxID=1862640 RepID=A0AAV8TZX9_9ROSI|nr:hypothetical protein K2173_027645 [Erythroxylum novogranatense]